MSIDTIAAQLDERKARRACAQMMAAMGELPQWNSETIEIVASYLVAIALAGLPTFTDSCQDDSAVEFWRAQWRDERVARVIDVDHVHHWQLTEAGYLRSWSTVVDETAKTIVASYSGSDDWSEEGSGHPYLECLGCGSTRDVAGYDLDYT